MSTMFTYALRAVILIGVLGWYSTGVWKMIDIYFKDKFEKYLREEFIKNPRIKTDLDEYRANKNKIDSTIRTPSNLKENINGEDSEATIDHKNGIKNEHLVKVNVLDTMGTNFEGNDDEKNKRILTSSPSGGSNNMHSSKDHENIETIIKAENQERIQSLPPKNNKVIGQSIKASDPMKKKKNRIKTITFTDEDFNMGKMNIPSDYDFSEFEYGENEESAKKSQGGINIASLPFKPNADLGHLDTITEDEFCPFKLNYKGEDCKDTKEWP